MENLKLLFRLYFRPASATSEIIDKGSWLFASVAFLLVSFAFQYWVNSNILQNDAVSRFDAYRTQSNFDAPPDYGGRLTPAQLEEAEYYADLDIEREFARERRPFPVLGNHALKFFAFDSFFTTPYLLLLIFYLPATILLLSFVGGVGNFGVVLQRDYGTLATCALMAWAAAHLPFAAAGLALSGQPIDAAVYLIFWLASSLLFGVLMVFALRTVFGASYAAAAATVCFSWLALSLGLLVFRFVSPWLFSPFLLIFAYVYFGGSIGGEVRGFGNAVRQRQNFKRFLHNATVNPRDADAHVQLALIYLQRRQEGKALEHLNKAIEIDKDEIDANYELGKLARRKGNLQAALDHFTVVVGQNDKHALSEIWREIGATYLEAKMPDEAREALEKFVARRAFDPEGLYYLGKVFKARGETGKAREMFGRAVESARNSPDFRRRELRYWSRLAQKEI